MICPACSGSGKTLGIACPGFRPITMTCHGCDGMGTISEKWWHEGGEILEARKRKRLTLRKAAKALGILASELSDYERGRRDPAGIAERVEALNGESV